MDSIKGYTITLLQFYINIDQNTHTRHTMSRLDITISIRIVTPWYDQVWAKREYIDRYMQNIISINDPFLGTLWGRPGGPGWWLCKKWAWWLSALHPTRLSALGIQLIQMFSDGCIIIRPLSAPKFVCSTWNSKFLAQSVQLACKDAEYFIIACLADFELVCEISLSGTPAENIITSRRPLTGRQKM